MLKSIKMLAVLVSIAFVASTSMAASRSEAYQTVVGDQADNNLKLNNGAEVRISGSFSRRLMGRTECVLFKSGMRWKIWLDGEGLYDCSLEEDPDDSASYAEEVSIMEVKYHGEVLLLEDGSIYEVDSRDARLCSNWRGHSEAIIIRERDLINYDDPDSMIRVKKLR